MFASAKIRNAPAPLARVQHEQNAEATKLEHEAIRREVEAQLNDLRAENDNLQKKLCDANEENKKKDETMRQNQMDLEADRAYYQQQLEQEMERAEEKDAELRERQVRCTVVKAYCRAKAASTHMRWLQKYWEENKKEMEQQCNRASTPAGSTPLASHIPAEDAETSTNFWLKPVKSLRLLNILGLTMMFLYVCFFFVSYKSFVHR